MNYDNVNLESGHGLNHRVTKCLHTEELQRDLAAAANFSQVMASDQVQQQEISQTPEGLIADLRSASNQKRVGFSLGGNTSTDAKWTVNDSIVVAREDRIVHEMEMKSQTVKAENAASIACFGLEDSLERPKVKSQENPIRVSGSRSLQFGNSFLRRKKEEIQSRVKESGRKWVRKVRAILGRNVQKVEKKQKETEPFQEQQEYLLDSYDKDGAYKQMSKGSLLKSNISEKA